MCRDADRLLAGGSISYEENFLGLQKFAESF